MKELQKQLRREQRRAEKAERELSQALGCQTTQNPIFRFRCVVFLIIFFIFWPTSMLHEFLHFHCQSSHSYTLIFSLPRNNITLTESRLR